MFVLHCSSGSTAKSWCCFEQPIGENPIDDGVIPEKMYVQYCLIVNYKMRHVYAVYTTSIMIFQYPCRIGESHTEVLLP